MLYFEAKGFAMTVTHAEISYTESERQRIRTHLEVLLECPAFAGSRRRQAFLRYVVEESLAGRGASIKETTIAVDVFGRDADFNAQSASIVRVTGGEVRKRLAQAYEGGLTSDVRIELPVGGYHPSFHLYEGVPSEAAPVSEEALPEERARPRRPWWPFGVAAVALTGIALWLAPGVTGIPTLRLTTPPIEKLWQPFVGHDHPVLISLVTPVLLAINEPDKWLPLRSGESIPTSALQEMDSAYVGTGGALGGALFAEQLATRHQPFVLKFSSDLSFADLKTGPAILVGASRWTRELTQNLRFRLARENGTLTIKDYQQADRSWGIRTGNVSGRAEGYSLVTRVMNSESGQPVMLAVGMDARNTQAAVEFLTRAEDFQTFASIAPPGWEKKSFQVVLHNTIHGNSPGSMRVVASHVW
jgi:hypothetical protein